MPVGGLQRRRSWRAYIHRHTGSAWTDSEFRMSVGSYIGSIDRSGTFIWFHAIPICCTRGQLLCPKRVMRQFGYTQTIPTPLADSWVSFDDIHDGWMHYSDHMATVDDICVVLGQCASDYMDWFFCILHFASIPHFAFHISHTLKPFQEASYIRFFWRHVQRHVYLFQMML